MIASRIATGKFAGLPNVILAREVMPEFLQYDATPDTLAREVTTLLTSDEARQKQVAGAAEVRRALSAPGTTPSDAAAAVVLRAAGLSQFGQTA